MKTSVPYSLKKGLAFLGVMALPFAFGGCEKDPVTPNNPNNPDNPQQQKHNVELVYGDKPSTNWQHIEIDTIQKYCNDTSVDTIFMIPENYRQFSALSTSALKNCVSKLRARHNVNPNKVFGKGPFEVRGSSVQNNQEIVRFIRDTMRYDVIINDYKSR